MACAAALLAALAALAIGASHSVVYLLDFAIYKPPDRCAHRTGRPKWAIELSEVGGCLRHASVGGLPRGALLCGSFPARCG